LPLSPIGSVPGACVFPRTRPSPPKPTVSLDVNSLATSSCGYYRDQIEPHNAHEFVVHVATQRRGRETYTTPPSATCSAVAPVQEHHCRRPRLPPEAWHRSGTLSHQGYPGGAHGRRNDSIASQFHGMRCPPVSPIFAS
jgi:hypothetical protein